tara:strand:+ start:1919 stop:2806 length:888 start_codon:yes stop_codon:yes gene_type:complete
MNMIKKNSSIEVISILSSNRSGSTLLDILIGSQNGVFSSGELKYITREGLLEEYCSCGDLIGECELWSDIFKKWLAKSEITLEEHRKLKLRYERIKMTFHLLFYSFYPSKDFIKYSNSLRVLLETISELSQCNTIIDSSKTPQRMLILKNIVKVKNIHLHRNPVGILNSSKKTAKIDIKKGREYERKSNRTLPAMSSWVLTNLMIELLVIGQQSTKVSYDEYIRDSSCLLQFNKNLDSFEGKKFNPEHILAGNRLRLKKDIQVFDKPEDNSNLSRAQLKFAKFLGFIFPFWTSKG